MVRRFAIFFALAAFSGGCSAIVGADFDHPADAGAGESSGTSSAGTSVGDAGKVCANLSCADGSATGETNGTTGTTASTSSPVDAGSTAVAGVHIGHIEARLSALIADQVDLNAIFVAVTQFSDASSDICAHTTLANGCTVQSCPTASYDDPDQIDGFEAGSPEVAEQVTAGDIEVEDQHGLPIATLFTSGDLYPASHGMQSVGQELFFDAPGQGFPAFKTRIALPNVATLTTPLTNTCAESSSPPAQDMSAPFAIRWSGGDPDTTLTVRLHEPAGGAATVWALCSAPMTDDALTIPASVWAALGKGTVTMDAVAIRRVETAVSNGTVYLESETPLGLSMCTTETTVQVQ
jgi:hypothetical protein